MNAKPEHEITYQELAKLLKRAADKYKLSSAEVLAIAANMLGKLLAFQDQRVMTEERAMLIIKTNIEIGNKQAISEVVNTKGNA